MTGKLTDSNVAQEQAAIRSETVADRMARIREAVDDVKIGFFNLTGGAIGYIGIVGEIAQEVKSLVLTFKTLGQVLKVVTSQEKLHAMWLGIVKVATAIWTGVQWLLNVALNANPIGLLVIAITAVVGMITLAIQKFSSWGATLLAFMGPIGWLVNGVMLLKNNWDSIVEAFKGEGILAGLQRIGTVLLDVVLYPLQQMLELIGKVFGFSFATKGAEKIQGLRDRMKLATPPKEAEQSAAENPAGGTEVSGQPGMASALLTGSSNVSLVPTHQTTSPAAVGQSSQSAVAGGNRNSNITLNLGKLMDNVNIYAQEFRDGLNDLDQKVLESLTRVLTVAQSGAV